MQLKSFKGGYDSNFSYLLWEGNEGIVIDTALDPLQIFEFAASHQISIKFAFVMHSHHDHIVALDKYDVPLIGSVHLPVEVNRRVVDGEEINVGGMKIKVLHAPGHTPDCILLLIGGKLFTTDVLFIDGCGRCDLKGGDARTMYDTLEMIKKLPDSTIIYPGHDYGPVAFDSLENQKRTNHFLTARSKEEFVRTRMGLE